MIRLYQNPRRTGKSVINCSHFRVDEMRLMDFTGFPPSQAGK
jgi:hypothetical protein